MKSSCETIKDLLPLYYDNVCSNESRTLVEEHIKECSSCEKQLKDISMEMHKPINKADEEKPIKIMKKVLKKGRVLAFIAGSIVAVIVISVVAISIMRISDNNSFESDFRYYLEGSDANESEIGVLRPGRYYMNGDTNSLFYEVFTNGTMQLFGDLSDLPEWDFFTKLERERDFERFDYVAVSYSLTRRGHIVRVDLPEDMPWQFGSAWYIYRDVTSIEDIKAEPRDTFAEIINGGNAFTIWSHVFIRNDI
ncbi:MAG: zf-HC2 domain-containing protein [Oscillospiraceae bacterium]|jgi:hypothetical protein|nr:zf-HC2 domain-containing protein [Oscillospiraceae bacterium]